MGAYTLFVRPGRAVYIHHFTKVPKTFRGIINIVYTGIMTAPLLEKHFRGTYIKLCYRVIRTTTVFSSSFTFSAYGFQEKDACYCRINSSRRYYLLESGA